MRKIIVTGFQPFADYPFNPTEKIARELNGKVFGDREVIGLVLPCTYYGAFARLMEYIEREKPDAIISTGLSSSVKGMIIESTFHNTMDGKYPDAENYNPEGLPILEDRAYSLSATANCVDLLKLLQLHDIPTELSVDADTFICNSLAYQTSSAILTLQMKMRNVFVHIPWTTQYKHAVPHRQGNMYLKDSIVRKGLELLIKHI